MVAIATELVLSVLAKADSRDLSGFEKSRERPVPQDASNSSTVPPQPSPRDVKVGELRSHLMRSCISQFAPPERLQLSWETVQRVGRRAFADLRISSRMEQRG
jgi:hypothetical protein